MRTVAVRRRGPPLTPYSAAAAPRCSPAVVAALGRTNSTCLTAGSCAHFPVKFVYSLTVTEIPCRRYAQPGTAVSNTGATRFAEPGTLLFPGK